MTFPKKTMRGDSRWKWTSAAAALIVTGAGAWWASRPAKPPAIVSIEVKVKGVVQTPAPSLPPLPRRSKH